jgi:hypothetical protein
MVIVDFIMKLIGRPPLLENGYPDMARNHGYVDIDGERIADITRRINNGGGFYFTAPPPPPIPQTPTEEPSQPMVADIVNKIKKQQPRTVPTTTSSMWCGTTITDFAKKIENEKDPLALDHLPLKHFLVKKYPWILDVTEVRVRPKGGAINGGVTDYVSGAIYYGPLEIHITVSPTHHSELMNPEIEKRVREKLYVDLISLITCMYENNNKDKPIIIFSPSHSETILEYVK